MCGKQTSGVFNPAKVLIERLKAAKEAEEAEAKANLIQQEITDDRADVHEDIDKDGDADDDDDDDN